MDQSDNGLSWIDHTWNKTDLQEAKDPYEILSLVDFDDHGISMRNSHLSFDL